MAMTPLLDKSACPEPSGAAVSPSLVSGIQLGSFRHQFELQGVRNPRRGAAALVLVDDLRVVEDCLAQFRPRLRWFRMNSSVYIRPRDDSITALP